MYDLTVKGTVANHTVNCINAKRVCILLTQIICGGLNIITVTTMIITVFLLDNNNYDEQYLLDSNDYNEHSLSSGQ